MASMAHSTGRLVRGRRFEFETLLRVLSPTHLLVIREAFYDRGSLRLLA